MFLRGSGLVSRGLVNKVCLAVQNLQILKGPLSLAVCTLNQKFTHFKSFFYQGCWNQGETYLVDSSGHMKAKMMASMMSLVPHIVGFSLFKN